VKLDALRQVWAEPRVPNPPVRVWRDWVLTGLLLVGAVLESVFRTNLGWPPVAFVLGAVVGIGLLWRRTHPLVVVIVVFSAHTLSDMVVHFGATQSAMLDSSVALVVLPYALGRWASGRDGVLGMSIMLGSLALHGPNGIRNWADVVGGVIFFVLPAVIGIAVRYRTAARLRETDQAKMREREQLARELHDTVAHHVSAIIIQAQAGRTVAATNPAAAVDVLEVIETEASRTLAEMRFMVSALRQGEDPDLAPQQGVADIERLARNVGTSPRVQVRIGDGLDDLRPSVGAAVYRLAQESITNAIRHARHATRVDVEVTDHDDGVHLTVRDDGDPTSFNANTSAGYGLIGMKERTKLLGGTLEAGPAQGRGWCVTAVLPRNGATA